MRQNIVTGQKLSSSKGAQSRRVVDVKLLSQQTSHFKCEILEARSEQQETIRRVEVELHELNYSSEMKIV